MSEYINRAEANAKKLKVDQIMSATVALFFKLNGTNKHESVKIWDGYRKKIRRIL